MAKAITTTETTQKRIETARLRNPSGICIGAGE
jgi:hypothetical protein